MFIQYEHKYKKVYLTAFRCRGPNKILSGRARKLSIDVQCLSGKRIAVFNRKVDNCPKMITKNAKKHCTSTCKKKLRAFIILEYRIALF